MNAYVTSPTEPEDVEPELPGTFSEETSLLPGDAPVQTPITPLPWTQILILLFAQLAEPITTHTLFPFINELVLSLDISRGDPNRAAYYVGVIESVFFITECATILQWNRLSDFIGRKPVLLVGLAGLCLSMTCFGLSRSFWALVVSRCLAGLLCANAAVRKSMLGELTDSTNIGRGAALMPLTWSFGATIGPFIGGALARPADRFPNTFTAHFWRDFPYFLPCATSAAFSAVAFVVASAYLKETNKAVKRTRNAGDDGPTTSGGCTARLPFRSVFTYRVVLSIISYALLALLGSSNDALQSVFYATPLHNGGLGFPPSTIGICLSAFGFINGTTQAIGFHSAVRWAGPRKVLLGGVTALAIVFMLFPVVGKLAHVSESAKWTVLVFQLILCVGIDAGYSCMFIFITASAPSPRYLGTVNGLAQTAVAGARAIGPAMSTSLFALSHQHDLLGGNAVYLFMITIALGVFFVASLLPKQAWTRALETHTG